MSMAVGTPAGTHLEVEIKLDAEPDFALPDLSGLPGVAAVQDGEVQRLEAVYLDSADLRLARHGTTFRRRTGGTDAGWHLKLPAAKKGRIEVRRAPGRSVRAVPPQLLGLVRVQLRGEPVAPVAGITTRRTVHRLLGAGDVVLAEVADDQVTAEALGEELTTSWWREIEVELLDGDDALLAATSALLIDAGARPAGADSKLQRALANRLEALRLPDVAAAADEAEEAKAAGKKGSEKKARKAHRKATASGPQQPAPTAGDVTVQYLTLQVAALIAEDPRVRLSADEGVHQMRVATRRMRTGLATFRPLFVDRAGEPMRDELKWLGGVLGAARDAEVMRARLRKEIAEQPAELVVGPVLRRVDIELRKAIREAHDAVVTALDSERYLALVGALERFVAQPPFSRRGEAPPSKELRARVRKACRRVEKLAAGLHDISDHAELDHRLHEVRIAAKRVRYAAEAVRPVVGKKAKTVADAMEEIQETLGDHQDAVVEREWLRDLGMCAFLAGENGFTFGRLHGLTDARAKHDEEVFADVWAATQKVIATWPG
jgi:CHAD domain-containing protein